MSWNTLTIDDSSLFANPRETFYGEFGKTKRMFHSSDLFIALDPDLWPRGMDIYMRHVVLSNERSIHERKRVKLVTAIAELGGLYAVTMAIFTTVYWIFAEPFRDLHLGVSFNQMKSQICRQEGMIMPNSAIDEQFEAGLGFFFNIYFFLNKRLSAFVPLLCLSGDKTNSVTFA